MNDQFTTPDWVKNAVFYQIFPDRFASSERLEKPHNLEAWEAAPTVYGMKGGDLQGVVERLDYLQGLGIDAIYFNPIFQSACSHRYHTHDYFQVDPILGGNRVFENLLSEAHHRGIKVVLDGVFNHASRGFFQFNHILEAGPASPFLDWFTVKGYPLNAYGPGRPNYKCWVDLPALPEFNTQNPQVRQFIFSVARYWIEQGIDGWRLDVPFCIDDDSFWQEFRRVVKSANPEAYIVGEIPWEAVRWLQGDQFDAVMNYQFTQACLGFFAGSSINRSLEQGMMGLPPTPVLNAPEFAQRMGQLLSLYPQQVALVQMNLLDSHDMPRFISLAGGDQASLRLAVLFQMTYPGAPCVYYGDEIGMVNGPSRIPEDCRYAFPWSEERWDHSLRAFFKSCIQLRKEHPALRTGTFETIHARGEHLAYMRQLGDERMVVMINNGASDWNADVALPAGPYREQAIPLNGLLNGWTSQTSAGRINGLSLPPRSGEVFYLPGEILLT